MATVSVPLRAIGLRAIRRGLTTQSVAYAVVLLAVGVLVLYPLVLIIQNSFQISRPGQPAIWTLDAWRTALNDRSMLEAIWNTLALAVVRQAIAFPIAIVLAWVLARTDIPGSHWLEFMFWIAFFLPTLPVTQGWILLLDPEYGLVNQVLRSLLYGDKSGTGPLNIYSFGGIVWAHLAHSTIAIKVMFLTPAFRNMDASLEESSKVCGASTLGTLTRIVVPIMAPILLVVLLLSVIHSLQTFEVEAILGPPIHLFVFSTKIYRLIHQEPPLFASATALSSMVLGLMVPLIVWQHWFTSRRSYATVTGQYRGGKVQLRRWRIPAFALVLTIGLITTLVPFVFLVIGTFMRLFGFFDLPSPWTTSHWERVLRDPIFLTSVRNTIVFAAGSAVVGVALCTLVAYIVVRSRHRSRGLLDFMTWLPSTLPGIILGLGLLWLFLGSPVLRVLYGTIFVMMIAAVIDGLTRGVQLVKSNLVQVGNELEEAARVSGGRWWDVYKDVLLPLLIPILILVGTLNFISAARNVSTVALLATSSTRPLSLLQLDFMVEGRYEAAAVVGVLVILFTTGVALVARTLGLRVGIRD